MWILGLYSRLQTVRSDLTSQLRAEDGQGLVEYGLIILLIAVFCIAALKILGGDIGKLLEKLGEEL
jgi:pilus assembly protein Flp/PilA